MTRKQSTLITDQDERRLTLLLDTKGHQFEARSVEMLEEELSRATVVSQTRIPANVVTMNSVVVFEDTESGQRAELTLVYPGAARNQSGRVSVMAPIGSALLGLSVGDAIAWPMPDGRRRRIRVLDVRYQPEAQGDFHL
jgi:regulator of nucleoside diphosphate kinase